MTVRNWSSTENPSDGVFGPAANSQSYMPPLSGDITLCCYGHEPYESGRQPPDPRLDELAAVLAEGNRLAFAIYDGAQQ